MTETIGQQLKQARESKSLSIQKVVQATHIRARHIEAMEADDFDSLPSPVQARAFLKLYAEYLGLSLDNFISRQRALIDEFPNELPIRELDAEDLEAVNPEIGKESDTRENKPTGNKIHGFFSKIVGSFRSSNVKSEEVTPAETDLPPQPSEESKNDTVISEEEPPASPLEPLPSQIKFNDIGNTLRQRRESLSLTLDEIEHHTHVRKHYLEEMEAGEFDRLPSSVQGRGMLNNYAHFLGLDVDTLLLTFAEGLQNQRLERQPKPDENTQKPKPKFPFGINLPVKNIIPPTLRRYFSVDMFVGSGLVLVLLVFAFWGTSRIINLREDITPQPTALSFSNLLISSPEADTETPSPTMTGSGISTIAPLPGETLVITLPAAGQGPIQVVVVAEQQAWVRVSVDFQVKYEGRMPAGSAYPFSGKTQIEVLTGNGIAITILYNQNNLGPMGNLGEVVDRIYTANAILNPTATFTPTPSITPTPTITVPPTNTVRPSSTPKVNP